MKMVSSCLVLVAVACATVQGAPQSSSASEGTSGSTDTNKPDTRFFNVQGGGFGNQGFGNQGFVNTGLGFPGQVNPGFVGVGGGFQGNFPHVNPVTIPPNTPVNVQGPGGSVVGVPIQQCSFYCRLPSTGQYGCCDNQQQSHPGQCPTPRPSCPPIRNFGRPPQSCSIDLDCPFPNKCCWDTCLEQRVCKAAGFEQQVFG